MRILYITRSYTPHDSRFLTALASSAHEITYQPLHEEVTKYERRPVPDGIRELPPLGGQEQFTAPEHWIRLVPNLKQVFDQVQPDLVHAGTIQTGAFMTALVGYHPLLAVSWGSDILVDPSRDRFWEWMTRYTLRCADMLLTDCSEVSEAAINLGIDRARIVQFPWGVDTQVYRSGPDTLGLRLRPGWEDSVIILSNRSWESNYGVLDLLKAFHVAHRHMPRLRLVLLGSGSLKSDVEHFIQEQELTELVLPIGATAPEALPAYLRSVDVYATCAYSDGSSVSLLEAMATGLPVLATERASNREWVSSPDHGLLVPFGDTPRIAAGLLELASLAPERRARIAVRNREAVEERANWPLNVAKLLAAYESLRPDLA